MRATTVVLPWFCLAATLTACTGPAGGDADPLEESDGVIEMWIEASDIVPTVVSLEWDVGPVDGARIELWRDGVVEREIPVSVGADGPQDTTVLGMKPSTTYEIRLFATTPDGPLASEPVEYTTGAQPSSLPHIEVDRLDPEAMTGGFLVTSVLTPPQAVILDRDGDYVWWYAPEGVETLSRAVLSKDGRSMLMGAGNVQGGEGTEIIKVTMDGSTETRLDTPERHHDFIERVDGSIAYLAYDRRTIQGQSILGDRLMEVEPDGLITQVYSVWDHHQPTPDDLGSDYGQGIDWPHANALELVDGGTSYLVSYLKMDAIAKVDRVTGEELWLLGGEESTLSRADGSTDYFDGQHGMDHLGDRLLVFSNELALGESAAVELRLDTDAGRADETWSYHPDPALQTLIMGDVERLATGNTVVTFSYNGQIHEVDPQGDPVWILSTGLGGALGYTTWMADLRSR